MRSSPASALPGAAPGLPQGAGAARGSRHSGVEVRAFTEADRVSALAWAGPDLLVGGPSGLRRYQGGRSSMRQLTRSDGFAGGAVTAIDTVGALWVATDGGVARQAAGEWSSHLPPVLVGTPVAALAGTRDGGELWAGGPRGLALLQHGVWKLVLRDLPVTALRLAADGRGVWAGSDGGGLYRVLADGAVVRQLGPASGCPLTRVRALGAGPEGGILAIGSGPAGERLLLVQGERCQSFRYQPDLGPSWAGRVAGETVIVAGQRLFRMVRVAPEEPVSAPLQVVPDEVAAGQGEGRVATGAPGTTGARPDQARALAERGRFELRPLEGRLPPEVTAYFADRHGLSVGTARQGATVIAAGAARHYRSGEVAGGGSHLTVACARAEEECYLATGGERGWRFDGERFIEVRADAEGKARLLAVAGDGRGRVVALSRRAGESLVRLSLLSAGGFAPLAAPAIKLPEGDPRVSLAAFAPDGRLWVGLRYWNGEGEDQAFGVAVLSPALDRVLYHRDFGEEGEPGGLGIPSDVRGIAFRGDEVWLATRSGAARIRGQEVRVFSEADFMETEFLSGIGVAADGSVWVSSHRGAGRYDGKTWCFMHAPPLGFRGGAMATEPRSGRLLIATDRGLVMVAPNGMTDLLDAGDGLLANTVVDLAVDGYGRAYLLGGNGVAVIQMAPQSGRR